MTLDTDRTFSSTVSLAEHANAICRMHKRLAITNRNRRNRTDFDIGAGKVGWVLLIRKSMVSMVSVVSVVSVVSAVNRPSALVERIAFFELPEKRAMELLEPGTHEWSRCKSSSRCCLGKPLAVHAQLAHLTQKGRFEDLSGVGKSFGISSGATAPVAAHSVPRNSTVMKPTHSIE